MRFEHHYGWAGLMKILGLGPRWSFIEVGAEHLRVTMGWGFRMRAPVRSIRSADKLNKPISWWFGIGVHGWFGEWAVNAARKPHVVIVFRDPQRAFTLGVPVKVRTLHLAPEDPDELLSALPAPRLAG
jgi:hypothetical protein